MAINLEAFFDGSSMARQIALTDPRGSWQLTFDRSHRTMAVNPWQIPKEAPEHVGDVVHDKVAAERQINRGRNVATLSEPN
jgi:hypothetical protein